jgi:hypothetical protein
MQSTNESQSQHGPTVSRSSILGLDLLTFLMADVRDGVGPYLPVFLKGGLHWQSGEIEEGATEPGFPYSEAGEGTWPPAPSRNPRLRY